MDELQRLVPLLSKRTKADAIGEIDARTGEIIRAAIARHPATPDATLDTLANDASRMVSYLATEQRGRRNGATADREMRAGWEATFWTTAAVWAAEKAYVFEPFETLSRKLADIASAGALVEFDDVAIASALAESGDARTSDDRAAALARHPVGFVLALVVARRKLTSAVEEALATAPVLPISTAWTLAQRATSPLALAALSRGNELNLRCYIAQNKNTPLEALELLASETWTDTLSGIAGHPNANDALLRRVAKNHDATSLFLSLANNPRAPSDVLAACVKSGDKSARTRVSEHPNLDADTARLLASDRSVLVRSHVGRNPRAPIDVAVALAGSRLATVLAETDGSEGDYFDLIAGLAVHPDARVREAVAQNPDCPPEIRTILAKEFPPHH